MPQLLEHKRNWGTSYGELVWREFRKNRLNILGLVFIASLFSIAILAPFLANDKPFAVRTHEGYRFPMFSSLNAIDYSILLAAVVACVQLFLVRRNRRRISPSDRGRILVRQLTVCATVVLAATIALMLTVRPRLDSTDYKSQLQSGSIERAWFAPVPYGYARTNLVSANQRPSSTHWLGTDDVGSDVLARLIHGSRISLAVGFVAVGISSIIGIFVGAIMGYFGGKVDFFGMRFVEIFMAVPTFFLIITAISVWERSIFNIMIIIGITSWTADARFIRAEFFKLRGQDFVLAARSLGLPLRSILFRHMLPNGIAPVLVSATFGIAGAIFVEAALSYLGFGVAPPTPSWGQMLSQGISVTGQFYWWLTIFPGLAIFLTVLAYNLVGEGLRDAIDPRLRRSL